MHPALPLLKQRGQQGCAGVNLVLGQPLVQHALDFPKGVDDRGDDLAERHFVWSFHRGRTGDRHALFIKGFRVYQVGASETLDQNSLKSRNVDPIGRFRTRAHVCLDGSRAARQFGRLPSMVQIAQRKDKNDVDAFKALAVVVYLADPETRRARTGSSRRG